MLWLVLLGHEDVNREYPQIQWMVQVPKNSGRNERLFTQAAAPRGSDHFSFAERVFFKTFKSWMSDRAHAKWSLRRAFGVGNPDRPRTFSEKIQWLKLYDRKPLYAALADKYAVRQYVADQIGEKYLNRMLGVYECPEQIEYESLPEQFAIKATHGSGMNVLVQAKAALDRLTTEKLLRKWLRTDYYRLGREWVYRAVPRRIICEQLLHDAQNRAPNDYKVFCFNGEPRFIQVDIDRYTDHKRIFYSTNWHRQPFGLCYPIPQSPVSQPDNLEEIVHLAGQLSAETTFCRVDFYSLPRIVFGEITFYPGNGLEAFLPAEWDLRLGALLSLPNSAGGLSTSSCGLGTAQCDKNESMPPLVLGKGRRE